ncbi:MAG: transglutaminaseTgpA domain-containing protein [Halieaceae bacterium]
MSSHNHKFWLPRRAIPTAAMQLLLLPSLIPNLGWSIPLLTVITSLIAVSTHQQSLPVVRLNRRAMNTLVVVSFGIWWWAFPSKLTLEPAVGLLLLGASLKLIEVKATRDAYVLVFSNIALGASLFLFDQSLWASITVLAVLALGLLALVEINTIIDQPKSLIRRIRFPMTIIFGAIPMTLVWFLVFPRVAPLWAIPVLGESVKMGMSDTRGCCRSRSRRQRRIPC